MAAADDGSLELDLLAASLRRDFADVSTFLESLAVKLEEAVPGLVRVERSRQGLFGPKAVKRLSIEAGSQRLALARTSGERVEASCGRVSGGIVLKSETVAIDDWLGALTEALAQEARSNERTRQALERLLLA